MLGTFTVRLFHGGHTQPIEQFNVLLRTRATGALYWRSDVSVPYPEGSGL